MPVDIPSGLQVTEEPLGNRPTLPDRLFVWPQLIDDVAPVAAARLGRADELAPML